jgi:SAM-dependent methyltransferase
VSVRSTDVLEIEEARIRAAYAARTIDERYSCFNNAHLLSLQQRERVLLAALKRHGIRSLASTSVLEIGCGNGHWLREFIKWGARPEHLTGIDLMADRVAEARHLSPPDVKTTVGSAIRLNESAGSVDIVLQSMVFTSILESSVRMQVAQEMLRVLKPDGLIIWYDYHVNSPGNREVRGVSRREIRRLFPSCRIELRRVTLVAPFARQIAPRFPSLSVLCGAIPWLCTHYLGIIRKA